MTTAGRVYRSRNAGPSREKLRAVRQVVSDVGAIVAIVCSIALFLMGIACMWRWL
jgi:hypothetical protein